MQNGDIKNFRLSNQCSAGNGMLLQAMADQFGVPVTEYADVAFKAELSPEVQLRLRGVPRLRPRELPEGGLLEGGAARRPRAGAAEERLAVRRADPAHGRARHASSCSRAARSTTWPRVKAQVDYIKERVPERRGVRAPAHRRGRRDRRRDRDAARGQAARPLDLHRPRRGDRPRVHGEERRETRCHFCPNNCARTFIDTKTPDGETAPLHRGLLLREGHRRVRGGDARRSPSERKKLMKQFPNLVDYEAKQLFRHFYDAAADAGATARSIEDVEVEKTLLGASSARAVERPFQRSSPEALGRRAARPRSASRSVLNIWSTGAVLAHLLRGARHPEAERRLLRRDRPRRCGPRAASTARSIPATRRRSRRRTSTTCSSTTTREKKPLKYIFFPILTHVPTFVEERDGQRVAARSSPARPNVMKAAFTKEIDFFATRGIEYLDPALTFTEPTLLQAADVRDLGPAARHHRGRERLRLRRGVARRCERLDDDLQGKGRAILETVEAENRVAHADARPAVPPRSGPEPRHPRGVPGARLPDPVDPLDPEGSESTWSASSTSDLKAGRIKTPLEISDVWPENYSANTAQKVWAAKFAARHPNVVVLDLSSFKCGHDAPTYGLIDSIIASAGDAVLGAARHRRQQAGRLDQDPRQDLRPLA